MVVPLINATSLKNQDEFRNGNVQRKVSEQIDQTSRGSETQVKGWRAPFMALGVFITVTHFFLTGLFISILQFFVYIAAKHMKKGSQIRRGLKYISGHLHYAIVAPLLAVFYYWFQIRLRISAKDEKFFKRILEPNVYLVVANHSHELDYLYIYTLLDQLSSIQKLKLMAKAELRLLPIIGWSLNMTDTVFVKRDWKRDRMNITKQLDEFYDYDRVIFNVYAEGTRYTDDKYLSSVEYAKQIGIEPFKHHLVPKPRGFVFTLRHLIRENEKRSKLNANGTKRDVKLINLESIMPVKRGFSDLTRGLPVHADIYCEEIEIGDEIRKEALESRDDLDCNDCPKMRKLLMDIFRRKDNIVDVYRGNKNNIIMIDNGKVFKYPFRYRKLSIIFWLISFCFSYVTLGYSILALESTANKFIIIVYISMCTFIFKRFRSESQIETKTK